ncbi:solute carrier family 25 member 38, partial [Cantharellus anzutake]|uniref:solute carrier family 25 member 38 n=1 Tax=Cantharellus anzutake TaxID=1750568 RepID=UPI001907F3D9
TGAVSGLVSATALQPLDLLKTRIQQKGTTKKRVNALSRVHPIFRFITSTVQNIVRKDGFLALWRGTAPTITRNVPGVALYFYALQNIRSAIAIIPPLNERNRPNVSTLPKASHGGNLLAGAMSRTIVGLVLNPITVIKARFESDRYAYRSMMEGFRALRQSPGGLTQGLLASALRDAPYAGLFVMSYEFLKEQNGKSIPMHWVTRKPEYTCHLSGGCAALFATTITHPFDVIKTNMQVNPARFPSLTRSGLSLAKDRGIIGCFDGMLLRVVKKVLSSVIAWTVYESLLLYSSTKM